MALAAKNLDYKTVEITPGVGQLSVFRLTGQKQVPVLIDKENIITDSSVIMRYLETQHPEPKLIPKDPQKAAQAHLIEDWADTTLASAAKYALLDATAVNPKILAELLPQNLPTSIKKIIFEAPLDFLLNINEIFNPREKEFLIESLESLSNLVEKTHEQLVNTNTQALQSW